MMILHDAIKTIQNGVFAFFKKNKNLFLKKNNKILTSEKNRRAVFLKKKRVFLNPDCLLMLFVIFPWLHDLEQVSSLSVWLGVRRTLRV